VVSSEFGALGKGSQHSSLEIWTDAARGESVSATEQRLCSVLEAISGDPCFDEHMTFDIAGHGFRIGPWRLGLAAVVEVVRPQTLTSHVWSPCVVPACEFRAQDVPVKGGRDRLVGAKSARNAAWGRRHVRPRGMVPGGCNQLAASPENVGTRHLRWRPLQVQ